jgi:hypothetical protein
MTHATLIEISKSVDALSKRALSWHVAYGGSDKNPISIFFTALGSVCAMNPIPKKLSKEGHEESTHHSSHKKKDDTCTRKKHE